MKVLSLLVSVVSLLLASFFTVTSFPGAGTFNGALLFLLLVLLVLISIVGIMINMPAHSRVHHNGLRQGKVK